MKNLISILLLTILFGVNTTTAQSNKLDKLASAQSDSLIHLEIQQRADGIFDSLVLTRRDFHMHPELSGQEKRTSDKIAQYLLSIGLEVKNNIGGFGVIGILKGAKEGKKIA